MLAVRIVSDRSVRSGAGGGGCSWRAAPPSNDGLPPAVVASFGTRELLLCPALTPSDDVGAAAGLLASARRSASPAFQIPATALALIRRSLTCM